MSKTREDYKRNRREVAAKEADKLWYSSEGRIDPPYENYVKYAQKCLKSGNIKEAISAYKYARNILQVNMRTIKRDYLKRADSLEETKKQARENIERKQKAYDKIGRNLERLEKLQKGTFRRFGMKSKNLEDKTKAIIAIAGLGAAIFFYNLI